MTNNISTDNLNKIRKLLKLKRYEVQDVITVAPYSFDEIIHGDRTRELVCWRQLIHVFMRLEGKTTTHIASRIYVNHSTILHSEKAILNALEFPKGACPHVINAINSVKDHVKKYTSKVDDVNVNEVVSLVELEKELLTKNI